MLTATAAQPHVLYRFWTADDVLLYVGLTADPGARWKAHSRKRKWWMDVTRVTVEHFPDRESVEKAEIDAIKTEGPLHNIAHQVLPPPKPLPEPAAEIPVEDIEGGTWSTTGEASTLLNVHEQTVRRWIDAGNVFRPDEVRRLPGRYRQVLATAVQRVLREMGEPS